MKIKGTAVGHNLYYLYECPVYIAALVTYEHKIRSVGIFYF